MTDDDMYYNKYVIIMELMHVHKGWGLLATWVHVILAR